jgi:polyphosphate kinase 2 (PPK2 family)
MKLENGAAAAVEKTNLKSGMATTTEAAVSPVAATAPDAAAIIVSKPVPSASIPLKDLRHNPEAIRHAFETGEYPYKTKLNDKSYMRQMADLQAELLKAQNWIKETGQKIVVLFEGRDAAGKGGTIKRFMEHLNPRGACVVALEKPTDRERTLWYFQR